MIILTLIMLLLWLYVTRGVGTTVVPDVEGRQLEEVKPFLAERDLGLRVHYKSSLQSPEGQIIRQIPSAGSRMKESRAVEVFVSKGAVKLSVPDLTGKSLLEARNFLMRQNRLEDSEASAFQLGSISRVYSETIPEDRVIAQEPVPSSKAVQGSEIDILLSMGPWPRRTIIPNLSGVALDKARSILEDHYLEAGNIRYTYRADSPASVVLKQFPPAGRLVNRNQAVTLTANLSEPDEKPAKSLYTYIRINPPLDVVEKKLRVVMKDRRGSRVVYDRMVPPGKSVEFLASVEGKAQLFLYWGGEFYRYRTLERVL